MLSFNLKFIDTLPNASLKWIEECGHVPHLEQPEQTAQVISEFLTESFPVSTATEKSSSTLLWGSLAAAIATAGGVAVEMSSNAF